MKIAVRVTRRPAELDPDGWQLLGRREALWLVEETIPGVLREIPIDKPALVLAPSGDVVVEWFPLPSAVEAMHNEMELTETVQASRFN